MPTPVCSASPGECKDPRIPATQLPWGWERAEAEGALVQMEAIVPWTSPGLRSHPSGSWGHQGAKQRKAKMECVNDFQDAFTLSPCHLVNLWGFKDTEDTEMLKRVYKGHILGFFFSSPSSYSPSPLLLLLFLLLFFYLQEWNRAFKTERQHACIPFRLCIDKRPAVYKSYHWSQACQLVPAIPALEGWHRGIASVKWGELGLHSEFRVC